MTKVTDLKRENIESIRKCFYEETVLTKNALSKMTGISLASCTNVLKHLLDLHEIEQIEDADSTGGRKSKQYILNKDHSHIAVIIFKKETNEYQFVLNVFDLFGNLCFEKIKRSRNGSIRDFETALKMLLKESNIGFLSISIPGVCVSGMISLCDFCAFENTDLRERIRRYTDIPFVIENDVNAGVIGLSDIYPDIRNMVLLYQPAHDHIGCGILIEGKLYNGHSHAAGEMRYLPSAEDNDQRKVLKDQMRIVKAVLDPEVIGWSSDVVKEDIDGDILRHVEDIYACIQKGLYLIGINAIKNGGI